MEVAPDPSDSEQSIYEDGQRSMIYNNGGLRKRKLGAEAQDDEELVDVYSHAGRSSSRRTSKIGGSKKRARRH